MREIARYYHTPEALIAAGYLRSLGFHVELGNYNTITAQPMLQHALGGVQLFVQEQDAAAAKRALDESAAVEDGPICSQCSSTNIRRKRAWGFPLVITAIFGEVFPFARATDELECRRCGHVWKDTGDEFEDDLR